MLNLLVSATVCAITWINPDGSVNSSGQAVWPKDMVCEVVKADQKLAPQMSYQITCETQQLICENK